MKDHWSLIVSPAADGPENMALDESLFNGIIEGELSLPVFRIYRWNAPCVTIGYFQQHDQFLYHHLPITRRLTGGLSVKHGNDVSYAFIAREDHWPHIYEQEETYRLLHSGIKEGLNSLGYAAEFYEISKEKQQTRTGNNICVESLFPYDLNIAGRKIVGSSQRQRGRNIMVQGSIHIKELLKDYTAAAAAIAVGWEKVLGIRLVKCGIEHEIEMRKETLRTGRYAAASWNSKT